jgi:GR25 family glycosyltransferase involved in LPS biosynthesis
MSKKLDSKKVIIYYINLNNRVDKNLEAIKQLSGLKLPFKRISAVADSDISLSNIEYDYFRLVSAVKQSHINACLEFLRSGFDYALVLEDDFIIDSNHFDHTLSEIILKITRHKVNFLQIGYLGFDEIPSRNCFELFARYSFERIYTLCTFMRNPFSTLVLGSVRWGAQAYLVDKFAAEYLFDAIDILGTKPMDLELKELAKNGRKNANHLRMARLKMNLVHQNAKFKSDVQGVY